MNDKTDTFSIGISMPVLNERKNIMNKLTEITEALKGVDYTVCIVDDGSKDGTLEIIQDLMEKDNRIILLNGVKKHYGCQRGAASRLALEWLVANTKHSIFAEIDADGAHRPSELIVGATQVSVLDYDIAIASKYVYGSKIIGRSLFRNAVSYFYSFLARALINSAIRDYSNCYRFYKRSAAECLLKFKPKYTSPVYLLEILAQWIANDFKIIEIPTTYMALGDNDSKVKFIDLIKGFFGTLDISLGFHTKRYRL